MPIGDARRITRRVEPPFHLIQPLLIAGAAIAGTTGRGEKQRHPLARIIENGRAGPFAAAGALAFGQQQAAIAPGPAPLVQQADAGMSMARARIGKGRGGQRHPQRAAGDRRCAGIAVLKRPHVPQIDLGQQPFHIRCAQHRCLRQRRCVQQADMRRRPGRCPVRYGGRMQIRFHVGQLCQSPSPKRVFSAY